MTETRTLTINRLPGPTWRWLKVNDAKVAVPVPAGGCEITREIPAGLICEEGVPASTEIETGMGGEVDSMIMESGVSPDRYTLKEGAAEGPLRLTYTCGGNGANDTLICLGDGAELTVIMTFLAEEGAEGTFLHRTKACLGKGAVLHLVQVQDLGKDVTFLCDVGTDHEEDAGLDLVQVVLSGKDTYLGERAGLAGKGSWLDINIGYRAGAGESIDMNYDAYHTGRRTRCEINAGGVLYAGAKKLFRGTIDFQPGCSGAVGSEKEDVLLMDDDVTNQTIPLILCAEEDVAGNHGATIGQPDEEVLFYMESRGISREAAYDLLAGSRIRAAAGHIKDEKTREYIERVLEGGTRHDG